MADANHEAKEEKQKKGPLIEEEEVVEEKEPPGPSFMALYTSLMMLLMTFFIVLFSMATTSTGRLHQAQDSIVEEFNTLGLTTSKRAIIFLHSYMKLRLATSKKRVEEREKTEDETEKKKQPEPLAEVYWARENFEKSSKIGSLVLLGLSIERKKEYVIIKIPNKELFYPNNTKFTIKGKTILKKVFRTISKDFESVIIQSYLGEDIEPLFKTGTDIERSFLLSAERASNIARFLSREVGITHNKISAYGNGVYRPVNPYPKNEDETAMNDRTEFWIKGLWLNESM